MKPVLVIILAICTLLLISSAIYAAVFTDKSSEVWGWLLFVGLLFGEATAGRANFTA